MLATFLERILAQINNSHEDYALEEEYLGRNGNTVTIKIHSDTYQISGVQNSTSAATITITKI